MSNKFLFSPEYYNLSAYYDEVVANLSWYQMNTDYNDQMYQYMYKIYNELRAKVVYPLQISSYRIVDDFVVNYQNATLQYGTYECSVPGKVAYMDSWFSCFLFQIPFFLEQIQLGWIGFVFILPIMLISIFGGIKESYKWFILNQAIWDAFLCYDFICARPTLLGWSPITFYPQQTTCFYRDKASPVGTFQYFVLQGFRVFLRNASFIPVFHLAFSRYICMYFPSFYKKFANNGYKIVIFIFLFNVVCIATFVASSITNTAVIISSINKKTGLCDDFCSMPQNYTYCYQNFPKYFRCTNSGDMDFADSYKASQKLTKIFKYTSYSITPIMFFLSIICAGFLFSKIASQLKFQLQTNRDAFKQTIKISSVVGFQCLTMSLIFVITGIQKYMQIKSQILDTLVLYDDLPLWVLLLQYYTTTSSLNMIRIIFDSCIVLIVLSGYSRCVVLTFKFLWLCLTNPKQAVKEIKYRITGSTEVTVLSTSRK